MRANEGNSGSTHIFMNAHMDSLGSTSTASVLSGPSIGNVTNYVQNQFLGNVSFVNVFEQKGKEDTDKE